MINGLYLHRNFPGPFGGKENDCKITDERLSFYIVFLKLATNGLNIKLKTFG
jgi:hypothetical protein